MRLFGLSLLLFFESVFGTLWVLESMPQEISRSAIDDCFSVGSDVPTCLHSIHWVERLDIRYHSPNLASLRLYSRQPVAKWGEQLIDSKGVVFPPGDVAYEALPVLQVESARLAESFKLLQEILSHHLPQVKIVRVTEGDQWEVEFADGPLVKLGSMPSQKIARVRAFFKKYPKLVVQKNAYFDFRNDIHVAIGKKRRNA